MMTKKYYAYVEVFFDHSGQPQAINPGVYCAPMPIREKANNGLLSRRLVGIFRTFNEAWNAAIQAIAKGEAQ